MGKPGQSKTNTPKCDTQKYYNILFLGTTGVGKSTFINAFVNYLLSESLSKAKEKPLTVMIKSKFTITDDDLCKKEIILDGISGTSKESEVAGDSATQESNTYTFPLLGKNISLRLIDTPGIGDTRGIDQDEENCENILQKISQYEELHAICILLKPNDARITALFEFSLKQLLSRLEKSATKNIVFIFTHSRATFYRPGDTLPALQRLLEGIKERPPHADIPLKKENIFCMDNEAFRFLMAMKEVEFTEDQIAQYERSWNVSREVCLKMLTYIMGDENNPGLTPHLTRETISINEARRAIVQLSQPLADISQLVYDNMYALEQHMTKLNRTNQTVDELKRNIFVPVIDIRETRFEQPRTVCADRKCCTTYTVQGKTKYHYSQRCHDPCYLRNVPVEIIGSPELLHCAAMGGTQTCKICRCDYSKHMHIYYETTVYETKIEDRNVVSEITNKEAAAKRVQELIQEIKQLKKEHEQEHDFILNSLAVFAYFLKTKAITAYNDAYKTYIGYLIDREKSLGDYADDDAIHHLQAALAQYEEYKKVLDSAKETDSQSISESSIRDRIGKLFAMKHFGQRIERLYNLKGSTCDAERDSNEYVHHTGLTLAREEEVEEAEEACDTRGQGGQKNAGKNAKNQGKNKNQGNQQQQAQNRGNNFQRNQNHPQRQFNQKQRFLLQNWQWRGQQPNYQWRNPQQPFYPPSQPYNYQPGPPPNHFQQGPPMGHMNYQQGPPPPFNFQGPPQQNWQQGYYQGQQQQFSPPQGQQQQQHQQQQNFDSGAGTSKENFEAPTGKYVPKPKNQNVDGKNMNSSEQNYSPMTLQENAATGVYNSENMNRKDDRRHSRGNLQQEQNIASSSENTYQRPSNYNNFNPNESTNPGQRTFRNTNYLHQKQGKNNFKKKSQHNNNFGPARAANRQQNDDDDDDSTEAQEFRAAPARRTPNDILVRRRVAMVVEQVRADEASSQHSVDDNLVVLNEASGQRVVSFLKKLFIN